MQEVCKLYNEALLRAENLGKQGLRFQDEDRKAIVAMLENLKGFNYKDVAHAIARAEWDGTGNYNNVYARHVQRLVTFLTQYGTLRVNLKCAPTPAVEEEEEVIVPLTTPISAMVQKKVDELIEIAVQYGVTSTHALTPYINRAIEKRKAQQKVEQFTQRLKEELALTGMTKEMALEALAAATASL